MYVAIDGADKTGKSSIIKILKDEELVDKIIANHGNRNRVHGDSIFTKQPGDPTVDVCVKFRDIVLNPNYNIADFSTEMVFVADMYENMSRTILPYMNSNVIITDRGLMTHYAYVYARNLLTEFMGQAYYKASQGILPNVTFIIRSTEEAIKSRNPEKEFGDKIDAVERKGIEFQKRVTDYFDYIVAASKVGQYVLPGTDVNYTHVIPIDNNGDIRDAVNEILHHIERLY